jgi:hypothetical protein
MIGYFVGFVTGDGLFCVLVEVELSAGLLVEAEDELPESCFIAAL